MASTLKIIVVEATMASRVWFDLHSDCTLFGRHVTPLYFFGSKWPVVPFLTNTFQTNIIYFWVLRMSGLSRCLGSPFHTSNDDIMISVYHAWQTSCTTGRSNKLWQGVRVSETAACAQELDPLPPLACNIPGNCQPLWSSSLVPKLV